MDWCLYFNKVHVVLEGFYGANWVSTNDDVSSTSGYVFTLVEELFRGLVQLALPWKLNSLLSSWQIKKQNG